MENQGRLDLEDFAAESVDIDALDLNREYCELPPRLAYWNAQLADATRVSMVAKAEWEAERARRLLEAREDARSEKSKPTVDEINAAVMLDEDVSDAHAVYIEKEADRLRVKGIVDAIICKRDMLQSLGAKLRIEMAADPVLREQMAGRSALDFGGD